MKNKKRMTIILIVLVIMFNASISFAYWASNIQGASHNTSALIIVGDWVEVPPGSIEVTEEVLEGLLTGDPAYPPDGDYVLTGDVDLSGSTETFEPIDNFTGTFTGNGYTIGGFELDYTNVDNSSEVGMFLNVGEDAEISDITVENVTVTQDDNNNTSNQSEVTYVGVIVGLNEGTLSNIEVVGSTIDAANEVSGFLGSGQLTLYAGGLVGRNNGTIINSYAQVDVILNAEVSSSWFSASTGTTYTGGLVGYNEGVISHSYATGSVETNVDTSTGGWGASVSINTYTGGLIGYNASGASVSDVFATGDITINVDTSSGNRYVGFVVGRNLGTTSNLYRLSSATITSNQSYTEYSANTTSTTAANLQSSTYLTNYLGFDFVDVWQEVPSDYPVLKED